MKKNTIKTVLASALCFLMAWSALPVSAQHDRKTIAVVLETPRQHIPDFHLVDRLNGVMAMYGELRVIVSEEQESIPEPPRSRFELERLVTWGQEAGIRYVIYIQVDKRRIVTDKKWSIPFLLSHYVVEGQLTGAYSLIDTRYRRLVDTWNLETVLAGPQQWQVTEDYPDDPDLHIPAPEKFEFMRRLEDLAAAAIIRNVTPNLRGR